MKRILLIEGEVPDLDQSFAKKLQDQLPTDLEMEDIPLQDLSTLAEQVHVATRKQQLILILICGNSLGLTKL